MLALALNDDDPLDDEKIKFEKEKVLIEKEDVWMIELYRYKDPLLDLAYKVHVTDELFQAIGRSRYVSGKKFVYIITNEPVFIPGIKRCHFKDEIGKKEQDRVKMKKNQILHLMGEKGELSTKMIVEASICRSNKTASVYAKELAEAEGWERIGHKYVCNDPEKIEYYRTLPASGYYLPDEQIPPS